MDVSQLLSADAANAATVIGATVEGAGAAISVSKKIREKFKKKDNPLLNRYYNDIMDDLDKDEKSVLTGNGALSNDEVYIDAYSVEYPETKILNTIDGWSSKDDYGVMLIHGEPGHGKTTLCRKAVYEYGMDRFCKDKTNVFWFRLNPAFAEGIIEDGTFVFKNAFCWGDPEIKLSRILLEENEKEYQNSVVFLDGYDELKAQLHGISLNLTDFIRKAEKFARTYNMHIVITTRTRSLSDEGRLNIPSLQFAPIFEGEQDAWIEKNAPDYKEDFEELRASSEKMEEMLGIPILFRMVVEARLKSTTAKNIVDLYDMLFGATMERRAADDAEMSYWREKYEQFAYEIYCNDETFADVRKMDMPEEFLYMFHLKGEGKQHVEFLHRSFYQYFLAHFLYQKMSEVEDEESAEAFLCCLAERRIDDEILAYVQQVKTSEICRKHVRLENCKYILGIIGRTDAVLENAIGKFVENIESIVEEWDPMEKIKHYTHYPILVDSSSSIRVVEMEVNYKKGTPIEQHRYLRCENIFVNAINICYVFTKISLRNNENILRLLRSYDCSGINLADTNLEGAHLEKAKLSFAKLNNIQLNGAYLSRANIDGAKLEGAGLNGADLSGIDLNGANLFNAKLRNADLRNADLRNTDLRRAKLSYADLRRVDLRGAKLTGADVEQAKIRRIDLKGIRLKGVLNLDKVNWQ